MFLVPYPHVLFCKENDSQSFYMYGVQIKFTVINNLISIIHVNIEANDAQGTELLMQ